MFCLLIRMRQTCYFFLRTHGVHFCLQYTVYHGCVRKPKEPSILEEWAPERQLYVHSTYIIVGCFGLNGLLNAKNVNANV